MDGADHRSRKSLLARLGSLIRGERPTSVSAAARVIRPRREDGIASHPTLGLTPSRARALLHAADAGNPAQQFELFHEMLQKWPRLAAVESTRRLALTGLDWEIIPGAGSRQGTAASDIEEVVDYCRTALDRLPSLDQVLDFLASAIGFGVGVAELVWEDGHLVDLTAVPMARLRTEAHEPWRLRVVTDDSPNEGVALDGLPNKWLIHQPRAHPSRPFAGGLLRASTLLYVAQNLGFKDWLIYSQVAGMPLRVAQYEPGVSDADKRELLRMLESLGTDAVAAFSKNIDVKILESGRSSQPPYQALQDYCNTEITILWLGQHLTTDIRQSGSRAAAEIHDRVREDLLVDDIADEAHTLRRDLLTPLVRARFGVDAPVPHFRRSLSQAVDTRVLADTLAVAVNQIGLRVSRAWAHRALGIPEANAEEAIVKQGVGS